MIFFGSPKENIFRLLKLNLEDKVRGTNLPVFPKNPVAWQSSTNVMAPYFCANLTILGRGATFPSIEKTPSVAIILSRLFRTAFSFNSKSIKRNLIKINLTWEAKTEILKIKFFKISQSSKIFFIMFLRQQIFEDYFLALRNFFRIYFPGQKG